MEDLKYPIGKVNIPDHIDDVTIAAWKKVIKEFPAKIKDETAGLSKSELDKQYRPGGWTITQVVNHCADSHMNSLIRFKLALTEEKPTIKPYLEERWAELPDSKNFPIDSSIQILEGVHKRWIQILDHLSTDDLNKTFQHPETNAFIDLKTNIGIYAWHCNHHLAHIINAKKA